MNSYSKDTPFTAEQELIHSFIHAFGVLFGIVSIPILTALAAKNANVPGIVGGSIYGFCFLMLFTFSTLYHGIQQPRIKRVLEIFDHISIYFLIAGTYTPFLLIYLDNSYGITLLIILWSLTVLGTFFKIFFTGRFELVSIIIYVAMGWILVTGGKLFFTSLPTNVLVFILIGAGLYTICILFYVWQRFWWHHTVWHFFILVAAICHYVAVLLAV